MPTASDEDRAKITEIFGGIDDGPIIQELESREFVLTPGWKWERHSSPNDYEEFLINFLMDEWDFGFYRHPREAH